MTRPMTDMEFRVGVSAVDTASRADGSTASRHVAPREDRNSTRSAPSARSAKNASAPIAVAVKLLPRIMPTNGTTYRASHHGSRCSTAATAKVSTPPAPATKATAKCAATPTYRCRSRNDASRAARSVMATRYPNTRLGWFVWNMGSSRNAQSNVSWTAQRSAATTSCTSRPSSSVAEAHTTTSRRAAHVRSRGTVSSGAGFDKEPAAWYEDAPPSVGILLLPTAALSSCCGRQ
mmetsp:Transcript_14449/g.57588  ORF Transcript_14449/g.57588 Transcript_14449/m.57588 type:complete len:234 (+) Transcript_14449:921-1622(+)